RDRSRRGGTAPADLGSPDRQPGCAQDQALGAAAADRRLCAGAPVKMRRPRPIDAGFDVALETLTRFDAGEDQKVIDAVRSIIADVRTRRDAAVLAYAQRFDRTSAQSLADLTVTADEARAALAELPSEQRQALQRA